LLSPGRPLAEGQDLLAHHRSDLDGTSIELIDASMAGDRARQDLESKLRDEGAAHRARNSSRAGRRHKVGSFLKLAWLSCFLRANYATKVATHHARNSYIRPTTEGCRRLRPYTHWCLGSPFESMVRGVMRQHHW
jgi:hypothetical protein